MAEGFTPIQTQEEFDSRIKDRLERERKKVEEQFADYGGLKEQITKLTQEKDGFEKDAKDQKEKTDGLQKQLDAANLKINGFETDKLRTDIAIQKGLPLELRSRLTGETKEEIEKDADILAGIFKAQNQQNLPLARLGNDGEGTEDDASYQKMLQELNLGGNE